MSIYRDYGTIGGAGYTGASNDTDRYSQVYQATHDGSQRLPYMKRSFISFSYGGKWIEEFNLIATVSGDRWERDGYSSFNDLTTTYDNLEGQQYWGTHFKTNTITFKLSTDGIDQQMLDNFLHWFIAGESRELILAEHPNRARMARVADPPQLSLLPFETQTSILISGQTYPVTTTLYKGDITLKLVMDDPHWYAKENLLGKKVDERDPITNEPRSRYIDYWDDANGQEQYIFNSPDALKILYEDGIPLGSMISSNMLLGNKAYADVENDTDACIWSLPEAQIVWTDGVPSGYGARIHGTVTDETLLVTSRTLAMIDGEGNISLNDENGEIINFDPTEDFSTDARECALGTYVGKIFGAIIYVNDEGIQSLDSYENAYFYYSGNAPSPAKITFTITPIVEELSGYVMGIQDSIISPTQPYSSIFIESENQQEFRFHWPNLFLSYNKSMEIINSNLYSGVAPEEIAKKIRETIRHPAVRSWMVHMLSKPYDLNTIDRRDVIEQISQFFMDSEGQTFPVTFIFDSKTGEAKMITSYRQALEDQSVQILNYELNSYNKLATIQTEGDLTAQQKYENIVTWGWGEYALVKDGQGNTIAEGTTGFTYAEAVQSFWDLYNYNVSNRIAMPGIFSVSNEIETTTVIHWNVEEDVGDMLYSNNIMIRDKNYPDADTGKIVHWRNSDVGRRYSHRFYHNLSVPMNSIQIEYQNLYL